MLSTGNDIVSLNAINVTRTKQPNFYSKILSSTETALHNEPHFAAIPFEIFVWLLWSIKESAFKYLQRINPDVLFTPVKFEVKGINIPNGFTINDFGQNESTGHGFDRFPAITSIITFERYTFYSNSLIYNEFISTVINQDKNFNNTHWGIKKIHNSDADKQSSQVRKFALKKMQKVFNDDNIIIKKDEHEIPVALQSDGIMIPISLSHHENWIAYSFQLNFTTEVKEH